jgi:hypothetical protein
LRYISRAGQCNGVQGEPDQLEAELAKAKRQVQISAIRRSPEYGTRRYVGLRRRLLYRSYKAIVTYDLIMIY